MYVLEVWADRPSLRSDEVKALVRAEFKCGIGASEEAVTRAYELYAMYRDDKGLELTGRVAAGYWQIFEESKLDRDWQSARKALDSLRSHLGIGGPDRVQITGTMGRSEDADMDPLSDEELRLLAELDRRDQEREGGGAH